MTRRSIEMSALHLAIFALFLSISFVQGSLIGELRVGRDYWNGLSEQEKDSCMMGFVVTHLSKSPEPYASPEMIPEIRDNLDWIYRSPRYDKIPLHVAFLYAVRLTDTAERESVIKELADAQTGWDTQW